jgi:hypothetical protein
VTEPLWATAQDGKGIDYEMAEYHHPLGFEPLAKALSISP